jgi:hypothetical protein
MSIVRREFVKIGAAGIAAAFLPTSKTFGQESSAERKSGTAVAELRSGSGSLYLEGRIAGGLLKLRIEDFIQAHHPSHDRALVAQGTFESSNGKPLKLYRSYFSCNHGRQVFLRLEDGEYSSTLVFSDTEDSNLEYLTAWSDDEAPQQFKIDPKKYFETRDQKKSILSDNADKLDGAQVGRRKPPAITQEDFENTFGNSEAFLEFMRGKKVTSQHAIAQAFSCRWAAGVKGAAMIGPMWEP